MNTQVLCFILISMLLVSNCIGRNLMENIDDNELYLNQRNTVIDSNERLIEKRIFGKLIKGIKNYFKSTAQREEELRRCKDVCVRNFCIIGAGGYYCDRKKEYDNCVNKCHHP
ncbi:hypothetical protein I4U23_031268 [Adineta vaga]|nr:hypothetical protein I4U23_031268 [Adineta vaga]